MSLSEKVLREVGKEEGYSEKEKFKETFYRYLPQNFCS
jgi:hypothetical protein